MSASGSVIRWRRPARGGGEEVADVVGILEEADAGSFAVRTRDGTLDVVPAGRALAGKVVPPPPARQPSFLARQVSAQMSAVVLPLRSPRTGHVASAPHAE